MSESKEGGATSPPPSPPTLVSPSRVKRLELGTKVFKAPTPSQRKSARKSKSTWMKENGTKAASTGDGNTTYHSLSEGAQGINHEPNKPIIKHHLLLEPTIERQKRKRRLETRHRMEMEDNQNSGDDLPRSIALAKKRMALARISKVEKMQGRNSNARDDEGMASSRNASASSRFYIPCAPYSSVDSNPDASRRSATDPRSLSPILSSDQDQVLIRPDVIASHEFHDSSSQLTPVASELPRHSCCSSHPLSKPLSRTLSSSSLECSKPKTKQTEETNSRYMFSIKKCLAATLEKTRENLGLSAESGINHAEYVCFGQLKDHLPGNDAKADGIDDASITAKPMTDMKAKKRRNKRDRQLLDSDCSRSLPLFLQRGMVPPSCNTSKSHDDERLDDNSPSSRTTSPVIDNSSIRQRNRHKGDMAYPPSSSIDQVACTPPLDTVSRNKPAPTAAVASSTGTFTVTELASRNWISKGALRRRAATKPHCSSKRNRTDGDAPEANDAGVDRELSNKLLDGTAASIPTSISRHPTFADVARHGISDAYEGQPGDHFLNHRSTTAPGSRLSLHPSASILAREIQDRCTLNGDTAGGFYVSPIESSFAWNSPFLSTLVRRSTPTNSSAHVTRLPFGGSGEVSMLLADMSRQGVASASNRAFTELNLLERQGLALEILVDATDLPTIVASLQHVKCLHQNTPLRPMIAKIVSDAEIRIRILMDECLLRQLTVPCSQGGLGYTLFHANSILSLLRPVLGSNIGLDTINGAKLLYLGLTSAEAVDLLPFMHQMEDEVLAKTYAIATRLGNLSARFF